MRIRERAANCRRAVAGLRRTPRLGMLVATAVAGLLTGGAVLAGGTGGVTVATNHGKPGPQGAGRTLLINNRTITPAGRQTDLGNLPVNAALSPDGGHLLVVNSGAGVQSLQVVATRTGQVVQTI